MKNTIKLKEFISLIEPLSNVIQQRHIMPILQSVYIDFQTDKTVVYGDDLEVRYSDEVLSKNESEFKICVDFASLFSALKTVKDDSVVFIVKGAVLTIKHKKGQFKIPVEDAELFLFPDRSDLSLSAKIDASQLKASLKIANKFVLSEDLEPMSNIMIEIGKKIIVRATNRYSLYYEKIKGKGDQKNILISGKAANVFYNLIGVEEKIKLSYNDNVICFNAGSKQINIIQQQGNFPVVVFDKAVDTIYESKKIEIKKESFISSIKRVSVLSMADKSQQLKLNFTNNEIEMLCNGEINQSHTKETVQCKHDLSGIIAFNAKFIVEILSVFDDKSTYGISDKNAFCIVSGKRKGTLMPMMLNQDS